MDIPALRDALLMAAGTAAATALGKALVDRYFSPTARLQRAEKKVPATPTPPPPSPPSPSPLFGLSLHGHGGMPPEVILQAKDVELAQLREELLTAQHALRRLRLELDVVTGEQLRLRAVETQLSDTQEALRKLRVRQDETAVEHAKLTAALGAERGHNLSLKAEIERLIKMEGPARPTREGLGHGRRTGSHRREGGD